MQNSIFISIFTPVRLIRQEEVFGGGKKKKRKRAEPQPPVLVVTPFPTVAWGEKKEYKTVRSTALQT